MYNYQEPAYEGEIEVYEGVGKVINRNQSCDISFYIGFSISYEETNQDWDSRFLTLTHFRFLQDI